MNKVPLALVLLIGSLAAWMALLGWDDDYQVDPVTGHQSGPYEAWQVVALGVVVVALAAWAGWRGSVVLPTLLVPIGLVVGFLTSVFTSATEQDGLFVVGAGLLWVGSSIGVAVVAALAYAVGAARRSRGAGSIRQA